MGISNFFSYISNIDGLKRPYQLCNTQVVIDGSNCNVQLYKKYNDTQKEDHMENGIDFKFGGNYGGYALHCTHFFDQLKKCGVKPIVVIEGISREYSCNFNRHFENLERLDEDRLDSIWPYLIEEVFLSVIDDLHVECLRTAYNSDLDLVKLANRLGCPLITVDSDLLLMNSENGVIMLMDVDWESPDQFGDNYSIYCQRFHVTDFINKFPGLTTKTLPLFAAIFCSDFYESMDIPFHNEYGKNFYYFLEERTPERYGKRMINGWNNNKYKNPNTRSCLRMKRMDRFLKWLSDFDDDCYSPIKQLEQYVKDLNEGRLANDVVTNLLGVLSANAFNHDNDTYLNRILDLKQTTIDHKEEFLKQILIDYNLLNDCTNLPDKIIYDYYMKTNISKWLFKFTEPNAIIYMKPMIEDHTLESCHNSSIDLVIILCRLFATYDRSNQIKIKCRKDQLLEEEQRYVWKESNVPNISQLVDLSRDKREEQFLYFLAMDPEELDLPDNYADDLEFWKYFVINVKYWINKTEMHNKFDLVDGLLVTTIYYKYENDIDSEAMERLAEDKPTNDDYNLQITHYYNEFQSIYRLINLLHSLLGHPIGNVGLHLTLNGVMISRIVSRNDEIIFRSDDLNDLKKIIIDAIGY